MINENFPKKLSRECVVRSSVSFSTPQNMTKHRDYTGFLCFFFQHHLPQDLFRTILRILTENN